MQFCLFPPLYKKVTLQCNWIQRLSLGAQYYLFRKTEASWEDAKAECVAHGRVLAKISSAEDQSWVENLRPYVSRFVLVQEELIGVDTDETANLG